jgi:hypothetical protein
MGEFSNIWNQHNEIIKDNNIKYKDPFQKIHKNNNINHNSSQVSKVKIRIPKSLKINEPNIRLGLID